MIAAPLTRDTEREIVAGKITSVTATVYQNGEVCYIEELVIQLPGAEKREIVLSGFANPAYIRCPNGQNEIWRPAEHFGRVSA